MFMNNEAMKKRNMFMNNEAMRNVNEEYVNE